MKRTIALLMASAVALTACARTGDDATVEMAFPDGGEAPEEAMQATDGADIGFSDVDVALADDRQVIRRASLQLHASDTRG